MSIPVIIPLGNGSLRGDAELRYLLRSLETNAIDLGTIYLVTVYKPEWLAESKDLVVVPFPDIHNDCKDANLFKKTHDTIKLYDLQDFVWSADDAAVLTPIELGKIPVIHNHRPNEIFYAQDATKWKNRVRNTIEWARKRGVELPHTYECHCPQLFNGQAIIKGMKDVNYYPDAKTIYTTWRVVTDTWHDSVNQPDWKWTFEHADDERLKTLTDEELRSKPFLGYNNASADLVMRRLDRLFPNKSKFERD